MSHIDVAIIGSGVAGLSAAISLQKLGLNVVVYEKDESFASRKQGYGMTLTNSLNGPLAALGILDACIEKSCVSSCHYIFNQMGDVLGYYGRELQDENIHTDRSNDGPQDSLSALVESTNDNKHPSDLKLRDYGGHRGNLRIPRQELRLMLLKQLLPDTVRWSHELLDYSDQDDHVELTVHSVEGLQEESKQVKARVLIGADGIRSKVRRLRDAKLGLLHRSPLTYLGVSVIIGLSSARHPLINARGFYVVDGTHRMFTMPYEQPKCTTGCDQEISGITMWQLSFSGLSEEQAHSLRRMSVNDLIEFALERTSSWFDPIPALIRSSIPEQVWSTGIYDRDPLPLLPKGQGTRVTLVGDAAHPMSMFKGQGANQAIADGPLLARWLGVGITEKTHLPPPSDDIACADASTCAMTGRIDLCNGADYATRKKRKRMIHRCNSTDAIPRDALQKMRGDLQNRTVIHTRLRCFEREMVVRAGCKQVQSRDAAKHLHSDDALTDVFGISGIRVGGVESSALPDSQYRDVLRILRNEGINARMGEGLDSAMRTVVMKLQLS